MRRPLLPCKGLCLLQAEMEEIAASAGGKFKPNDQVCVNPAFVTAKPQQLQNSRSSFYMANDPNHLSAAPCLTLDSAAAFAAHCRPGGLHCAPQTAHRAPGAGKKDMRTY